MSGLTGALFERQGIRAETQAAETQAQFNKEQAEINEQLALEQADQEATLIRQQGKRDISSAIASQAASGLVTTTGSPLLVQLDIAFEAEKEALTRIRQGTIEAQGFEAEQGFRSFEKHAAGERGKIQQKASLLSGIATDVQTFGPSAVTFATKTFGGKK